MQKFNLGTDLKDNKEKGGESWGRKQGLLWSCKMGNWFFNKRREIKYKVSESKEEKKNGYNVTIVCNWRRINMFG